MIQFQVKFKERGITKVFHFETFAAAAGTADALSRDGVLPSIHAVVDGVSGVMYRYVSPAQRVRGCGQIIKLVLKEMNNVSN